MTEPDLERLRNVYAEREQRVPKETSSFLNPVYLFTIQQRQRAMLKALRQLGYTSLRALDILEVGCGGGGVLAELTALGADPNRLTGIDLLGGRLREARHRLPSAQLSEADGQNLPYPCAHFDLVLQFTAFSSILDGLIRRRVAAEMLRALKPGGALLWYDFWWNPTNPQTRGIRPREVRELFPGCVYHFERVTLAPPIARRLVPVSWQAAALLDSLRLFNSHFFATIQHKQTK